MDIFEQEYKAGLQKTAAFQFNEILTKIGKEETCKKCGKGIVKEGEIYKCGCGVTKTGAELDTSGIMNKKNPVGIPESGMDAGSVLEGLRKLEKAKFGPTGLTERTINAAPTTRKVELTEEDFPLGGMPRKEPKSVSPARIKLAAEARRSASVTLSPSSRLSPGEKAGLAVLGVGGAGLGTYGAYKAHKATQTGQKALERAGAAGKSVAEQAKVVGDKVSQAADSLTEASKSVSKTVQPVVDAVEKGKEVKGKVQSTVGKVVDKGRQAKDTAKSTVGRVKSVVSDVAEKAPGFLKRIVKRGEDLSSTQLMMKVAAEGNVRTLEGWNKTAADKDDAYVRRVGREGLRRGAILGGVLGGGVGGATGAFRGSRGGSLKSTLVGAGLGTAVGAGVGALTGGQGLKAIGERSARRLSSKRRRQAEDYNKAHASFERGKSSRKQFEKDTRKFLTPMGKGHMAGSVVDKMASAMPIVASPISKPQEVRDATIRGGVGGGLLGAGLGAAISSAVARKSPVALGLGVVGGGLAGGAIGGLASRAIAQDTPESVFQARKNLRKAEHMYGGGELGNKERLRATLIAGNRSTQSAGYPRLQSDFLSRDRPGAMVPDTVTVGRRLGRPDGEPMLEQSFRRVPREG